MRWFHYFPPQFISFKTLLFYDLFLESCSNALFHQQLSVLWAHSVSLHTGYSFMYFKEMKIIEWWLECAWIEPSASLRMYAYIIIIYF